MKREISYILLGLVLLAIIGSVVYFGGTSQSILSVSSVNVGSDGKVYWVATASANSQSGETFYFNPSKYVSTDGSGKTVTPKQSLALTVSKVDSKCVYLTTPIYQTATNRVDHYILNNPQKEANVNFVDGNGKTTTIDGTVVQEATITDNDGSGKVRIQTQGLLSGKYNCPGYENVVLYNGKFYYKDGFSQLFKTINNQFTNTFTSYSVSGDFKTVTGNIDLGNVVYTITADQDYFDSVVYIPPTIAEPDITGINSPSEVQQGSTSSITVNIKNKVSTAGNIIVTPSSDVLTFSPTVTNINLPSSGSITVPFNIRAINSATSGKITMQACGSSQFSSDVKCDTYSKDIKITSKPPSEFCGDGICQSSETASTCQQDCATPPPPPPPPECKWYQDSYSGKFLFLNVKGCSPAIWLIILIGIAVVLFLIFIFILYRRITS